MGERYPGQHWAEAQQKWFLMLARHGHITLTSRASVSPFLKVTPRCYSCACSLTPCWGLTFHGIQDLLALLQFKLSSGPGQQKQGKDLIKLGVDLHLAVQQSDRDQQQYS